MGMKTLNVDSLVNSALMAVAKEMAKNDISIYAADPNGLLRNLLKAALAPIVADHRVQTLRAMNHADSL